MSFSKCFSLNLYFTCPNGQKVIKKTYVASCNLSIVPHLISLYKYKPMEEECAADDADNCAAYYIDLRMLIL